MTRRLACVDIPQLSLQILLRRHPEWEGDPIVLLEKDEANGRILDANDAAAALGLGTGMRYGAALGIHPGLKGDVLPPNDFETCRRSLEAALLNFSPYVERSWFQDGTYWLDARGLSTLFSSVRPWLDGLESAMADLGFSCGFSVGTSRFATYSAARLRPSGQVNIFADVEGEREWMKRVPVNVIPMSADVLRLFKRLKLLTIADIMSIPPEETAQRLSPEAARMVRFIRDEGNLPLQYVLPRDEPEWTFEPEDPMICASDLHFAGKELLASCLERGELSSLHILSVDFHLISDEETLRISLKPARPTRDGELLMRYWDARLENLELQHPVRKIRCRGTYTKNRSPQADLFGRDLVDNRREARKTLSSIQAEGGPGSVMRAEIIDHPLPTRCFRLVEWDDFPKMTASADSAEAERPSGVRAADPDDTPQTVVRRIMLSPKPTSRPPSASSTVEYSGGWWDVPYQHRMAYRSGRGGWEWLQSEGDEDWRIVGRVD